MERIYIKGSKKLSGEIEVGGCKNAAHPILFSTILVEGKCIIENLPDVDDIKTDIEILKSLGAEVRELDKGVVEVNTDSITHACVPSELAKKIRASYYVWGAGLGRFGYSECAFPGGCDLGKRPVDQHIKGFEALGAEITEQDNVIICSKGEGLQGASVYLDGAYVGPTINIMLAAAKTPGLTVIENAAKEPHIVDLANFLNSCGADIKGAGTEVIKIRGVEKLVGCTYAIIPDMIEAGTYMVTAAATGSRIKINNVIPKHLESITAKLQEMGVTVEELDDSVIVSREDNSQLKKVRVKTLYYPGIPTDMNPQICVLLCLADGVSTIYESIFESRFKYTEELKRMGAEIEVHERTATIKGKPFLQGAVVRALDLRAGVAMIIAGLAAQGTTWIDEIYHIERGYENIVDKLRGIGADIKKVVMSDFTTNGAN